MTNERIETVLRQMVTKLDELDHKIDQLLYEDYIDEPTRGEPRKMNIDDDFVSEEDIISKGQKVAYNKITDRRSMDEFKNFVTYIRTHPKEFSQKEYDYAGFADKDFSDVRLSDNSRRILGSAYSKIHNKVWDFQFIRGNMFKFQGSICWRWNDGSED